MDAFAQAGVEEERVRRELEMLDWRGGQTTAEIVAQLPDLPRELSWDLADGAVFHSPDEVVAGLRGQIDMDPADLPSEGAASIGGPEGYGGSSTGRLVRSPSTSGGIGSGTDTGDTGSGSTAATGWGRPGTTFGEEAVELEAEEEASGEEEPGTGVP